MTIKLKFIGKIKIFRLRELFINYIFFQKTMSNTNVNNFLRSQGYLLQLTYSYCMKLFYYLLKIILFSTFPQALIL